MIDQKERDTQLLAMAGNAALMAGDYGQGTAYLRQATMADAGGDSAELHEQLASAYLFGREPDKAIRELKAVIAKNSGRFRSAALLVLAHLQNRDIDAALQQAEETIRKFPDEPGAYHLLGNVYLFSGDIDNAAQQFRKAVDINDGFLPSLQNLALLAMRSGDYSQARQYYEQMLKQDPSSSAAMEGMAQIEGRNNNTRAALDWLDKARKANAQDLNARLSLARIQLRRRNLAEVKTLIDEMSEINPDDARVMALRAEVQVRENRYQDALATYEDLVSRKPSDVALQVNLAAVQGKLGQIDSAKKTLQKTVESRPDYYPATALLAFLEQKTGNQEAVHSLVSAYQHQQPESPMGYILEGDLLMAQGRYDEADKAYTVAGSKNNSSQLVEKRYQAMKLGGDADRARNVAAQWLEQHPDDMGITMLLADDHMVNGGNTRAISLYRKVLDKQPENVAALNNIALAYLAEKDQQALKMAEKANRLAPDNASIMDTYGWILVNMGDVDRGTDLLARATQQDHSNPEIRYHYAVGLERSGQEVKAKRILEELLSSSQQDFNGRDEARKLLHSL
jgi:putative PEP-CTERM system TPR-repeat lipoprotein